MDHAGTIALITCRVARTAPLARPTGWGGRFLPGGWAPDTLAISGSSREELLKRLSEQIEDVPRLTR